MKAKKRNKVLKVRTSKMSLAAPSFEYDKDFFKWTDIQAKLLKKGKFAELDIDNLIQEIESLGRTEKRTLESHLANLFLHLLKIKYQPGKHTRSWDLSVKNAEYQAKKVYSQNPSLKKHLSEIFKDAYYIARLRAIDETGLEEDIFSKNCLWKVEEIFPEAKVKSKKK